MTVTNNTSSPRKTLASQLDRLDSLLDGLGESLNEAVATAVQQAVSVAVQQAVVEVLTNQDLQRLLHPPAPQPASPPPPDPPAVQGKGGLLLGVLGLARRTWAAARAAAGSAWGRVQAVARGAGQLAQAGVQRLRRGACALYALLMTSRVAKAVGVGTLAALACYVSGPVAGVLGNLARSVPGLLSKAVASVLSFLNGG